MKKNAIIISILLVAIVGVLAIVLNYGKVNWDYNLNVSEKFNQYQDYWLMNGIMNDENGYYVVRKSGQLNQLYYISSDLKDGELVCEQANCKHTDENCKATFGPKTSKFQYCNGYIFYKNIEDNQENWLYRCNVDGSNRTKLMLLGDSNDVYTIQFLYVHKNHVIAEQIMSDGNSTRLVDFDMNGDGKYSKSKVIAQRPIDERYYFLLSIKDDKLLYQLIDNGSKVYEYNLADTSNELVYESDSVCSNAKYYRDGFVVSTAGKLVWVFSGKEAEIFNHDSEKVSAFNVDGKYIYIYCGETVGQEYVVAYDDKFNEVTRIDCTAEKEGDLGLWCYFSDGKNLLFGRSDMKKMLVCKLDEFTSGDIKLHTVWFK